MLIADKGYAIRIIAFNKLKVSAFNRLTIVKKVIPWRNPSKCAGLAPNRIFISVRSLK
jgi:hypothetical protein